MDIKLIRIYTTKHGRKQAYYVINGKKKTRNYSRFLMEQHLNRELLTKEHVDHINGDKTDDRIENLQVLTQAENAIKAIKETGRSEKWYIFICPECGYDAQIPLRTYRKNQLYSGKSGPYCSKSCSYKARGRIISKRERLWKPAAVVSTDDTGNAPTNT